MLEHGDGCKRIDLLHLWHATLPAGLTPLETYISKTNDATIEIYTFFAKTSSVSKIFVSKIA